MIKFKLQEGAKLPQRGSEFAAGLDIHCLEDVWLSGGKRQLIHTGVLLAGLPPTTYLRVAPRSKLANKFGIGVLAGVIDADYRGELCVILKADEDAHFPAGSAIAQLIPTFYFNAPAVEVTELDDTERGNAGINDKDLRL